MLTREQLEQQAWLDYRDLVGKVVEITSVHSIEGWEDCSGTLARILETSDYCVVEWNELDGVEGIEPMYLIEILELGDLDPELLCLLESNECNAYVDGTSRYLDGRVIPSGIVRVLADPEADRSAALAKFRATQRTDLAI